MGITGQQAEDAKASVMDTAHWIATYRAMESQRKDALFCDPFAARLAERAGALPSGIPPWPMIVRTKTIDDLVEEAIDEGIDCVLNLAAGLDTRPYRLNLPHELVWIEADLPRTVDEKNRLLVDATPRCQLIRRKVDLLDVAARESFLDEVLANAPRTLVITEGFLLYLENREVESLARALAQRAPIVAWISDIVSPGLLRKLRSQTDTVLDERDRMRFGPSNGVSFYENCGWSAVDIRSAIAEGRKFNRLPFLFRLLSLLPDADPRNPGNRPWGAVVRLEPPRLVTKFDGQ
jgi:methyltransferase (TIGR00027 family)